MSEQDTGRGTGPRPGRPVRKPSPAGPKGLGAWLVLFWERLARAAWVPALVAGLFVAVALFDLLPPLNGWLHTAVLALFGLGFAAACYFGFRGFRWPTGREARRRLEIANGLEHRPLTTVQDDLAVGRGDAGAEGAWRLHQERARRRLGRLRVGGPNPVVTMLDRYALRGVVMLLLVLGATVSWGDMGPRLNRVFTPVYDTAPETAVIVEAWFTPPEYTGEAPRMVSSASPEEGPVTVPAGTRVMVQVHGGRGQPRVTLGRQAVTLEMLDDTSYQAELLIPYGGNLVVTQRGRTIVDWRIDVREDEAPTVSFTQDLSTTEHATVRFDYEARDDYRIKEIRALIARRGEDEILRVDLPVTGRREARSTSYHDLAAHRWAGLEVAIRLEVVDDQGQTGRSDIVEMTLPEREFRNPVARLLIEQRRRLTTNPDEYEAVVGVLQQVIEQPDSFLNDSVVYLALRISQWRLLIAGDDNGERQNTIRERLDRAIGEVQDILWETALRLEDGGLSQRAREMARLRRELSERLNQDNPDPQELQQLLEEFERAMREYLEALREHMRQNPDQYVPPEQNQDLQSMTPEELSQLMDRLRDMLQSGDREAMQRLLSELQNFMQGMRQPQGQQLPPNHPAAQIMRELGDIIRQQRELQEETFRRHQEREAERQNNPDRNPNPGQQEQDQRADRQAQEQQEELRQRLGDLMRRLGELTGEVPDNLGNAERHMNRSRRALQDGQPGASAEEQAQALRELQRGGQQAMQSLGRAFGMRLRMGMRGNRPGEAGRWWGRDRDPLGRRMEGMGPLNTEDVEVPTESEAKRARDILEELRRRSGERDRPQEELDYIERLLRRF